MKLIKDKCKQLDVNKKWVEKNVSPYRENFVDRRFLNGKHIRMLANKIKTGKNTIADISFAYLNYELDEHGYPVKIVINGNHFSAAISLADIECPVSLQYWEVDSKEDAAMLFRQYDTDMEHRSNPQILKPFISAIGKPWPISTALLLMRSLKMGGHVLSDYSKARGDQVDSLKLYTAEGDFLNRLVSGPNKSIIKLTPISAAMINCFRKDKKWAIKFWESIRDGLNLNQDDHEYILRNYLLKLNGVKRDKTEITDIDIYNKCIVIWNKFRLGKKITKIMIPKREREEQIRLKVI